MSTTSTETRFAYEYMLGLNPSETPNAQRAPFKDVIRLRRIRERSGVFKLCPTFGIMSSLFFSLYPSIRNVLRCYATITAARSAVLTGKAAACVLGIPFLENTTNLKTVQLTLPGNMKPPARSQRSSYVSYTSRVLPERDIVVENGIRVTSIPRTFLDLVVYESEDIAASFIEAAYFYGRATKAGITHEIQHMPALKGKPRALRLLAMTRENSESLYETKARRMIEEADLACITSIETQAEVPCGNTTYRIDILINGYLGIEIDGRCKTAGRPEVLIDERIREKRIQNQGYLIIRYHPDELNSAFILDVVNVLTNCKQKLAAA